MSTKKKIVLIPSAYNHRAMGDIEGFLPFCKEEFDTYVITDLDFGEEEVSVIDGVTYVTKRTWSATYLEVMADYVIDAGAIRGSNKYYRRQKRISVWHGTPYKKMFADLGDRYVLDAINYSANMDLMVSPSPWYTQRFLRQSMLFSGEVLETAISRTDSLFISNSEVQNVKKELGIPDDKRILLYAPTYRDRGSVKLPFSVNKAQRTLGDDWVIVVKLHYLNELASSRGVLDATDYGSVNKLLAAADCLITDYSSLLFDYSILGKPAILYQYDQDAYRTERDFMFELTDFVDSKHIATNEDELISKLSHINSIGATLTKVRKAFYPHQHANATSELVEQLNLNSDRRDVEEVIFLVNDLNEIGGVHSFILNLARELKEKFNSKTVVIGANEFNYDKERPYIFDEANTIDVKLSGENDQGAISAILSRTNGYIISCQYSAHSRFQRYLDGKKSILMFHGDTKDVVSRHMYEAHLDAYNEGGVYNFRRLVFLSHGNWNVIREHLFDAIRDKAIFIENGIDFSDSLDLYAESGQFAFVSRLDQDKNPLELIEIFANSRLNPSYHLHIYGDGSLRPEIETMIKEQGLETRITLHGFVESKTEIYSGKQGVLLASLSEGLPLTLLESIKFGIPVYSYDSFTASKDIVTEHTGVLVKASDKEGFVDALNNPFDIAHFDKSETMERFSNNTVTQRWKDLFDALDKEPEPGPESNIDDDDDAGNQILKRAKTAIRKSPVFKGTSRYAELSVHWRNLRHPHSQENAPLVSVVMPFYNNLETVRAAVRSVSRSGYDNYEIILVNDGSAEDPTPLLKRFDRVSYYYKENGGLSSTRNYGIDRCKGKYVLFLDSDDTLYPGALNRLVSFAEENKLDMVSGKTVRHYVESGKNEIWYKGIYCNDYINDIHHRSRIIDDTIATAKLYRLDMLNEHGMRFQSGLYEDILFTGTLYALVDRIGIVKGITQKWMVYGTGTSITTKLTIDNTRARLANLDTVFQLHSELVQVYLTRQYVRHQLRVCIYWFNHYSDEERAELFKMLRKGLLLRERFIVKKLIMEPSQTFLYRSILDNNYEQFCLIAKAYSAFYFDVHAKN